MWYTEINPTEELGVNSGHLPEVENVTQKTELSRGVTDHLTVSMVIEREKRIWRRLPKNWKKFSTTEGHILSTLKVVKCSWQDQRMKTNTKHHLSPWNFRTPEIQIQ